MLRTEKINKKNRPKIIDFLEADVTRHVFAFYDIQHEPLHTTTYVAFENDEIKGYLLNYTGTDVVSTVLECNEDVAETLINYAPSDHFILHTQSSLISAIRKRFPSEKHYVENWMLVNRGEMNSFKSELSRQLRADDASDLAQLLSSRTDRPKRNLKKYASWISKMPLYGIFVDGELVSYAGSFIQLPQVWMIGGVYTEPKHRNMGYATLAVSAITKEALEKAEKAALFVRSDNYPAIRAYERIGYRKIGEKLWVDIGTGLKP